LDTLEQRLAEYKKLGATFTKWRSVIKIGEGIPTDICIETNMSDMARYAYLAEEAGLVPICEPEVLLSGNHTIEKSEEVLTKTLIALFENLVNHKVDLSCLILKTSMVLPGDKSGQSVSDEEIAKRTVKVLKNHVPASVGGIVFLSGGQGSEEAIKHLNLIAKAEPLPWEIAFSYARALQGEPLKIWKGKEENVSSAREAFSEVLKEISLADQGILDK
jgi:fructose-bisphosphate aldolase class I